MVTIQEKLKVGDPFRHHVKGHMMDDAITILEVLDQPKTSEEKEKISARIKELTASGKKIGFLDGLNYQDDPEIAPLFDENKVYITEY